MAKRSVIGRGPDQVSTERGIWTHGRIDSPQFASQLGALKALLHIVLDERDEARRLLSNARQEVRDALDLADGNYLTEVGYLTLESVAAPKVETAE